MRPPSLLALSFLLCAGCSLTSLQTPRTVEPGRFRFAVGFGAGHWSTSTGPSAGPSLELAGRYGLNDRLDVGLKLFPIGGQLDLKWQLLRAPAVDVSLAPAVAVSATGVVNPQALVALHLPLLMGFNFSENVTVLAVPRLMAFPGTLTLYGGGGLGLALEVSDGIVFLPEASLITNALPTRLSNPGQERIYQVGLGILFGGGDGAGYDRAREPPEPPT